MLVLTRLSKNPRIQALVDEIINDGSTEDHTTPPQKKSPVDLYGEKALPLLPPVIVAEVFREIPLPEAPPPKVVADTFQISFTNSTTRGSSCSISRGTIIRNIITTKN